MASILRSSLILLAGYASAVETEEFMKEQQKLACYVYTDFEFYNILDIQQETDYSHTSASGTTYAWNFCKFDVKCPASEKEALASATTGGTCESLSGSSPKSIASQAVSVDGNINKSLYLTYSGGDKCASDSKKTHDLEIRLVCDSQTTDAEFTSIDETNPCKTVISMKSKHGCPAFSTTAWISFLADNPYILGVVLIVFGAIVTFFGRKFFQYTIAIVGFGVGFLTTMLLFSLMGMLDGLETEKSSIAGTVVSFVVASIVGLFLGFVMYKTIKFGAMILGAISGGLIGITLYNLIFFATDSFYLLVATTALIGVIGAFLAYKYYD
jgi:hypothetical protein